VPRIAEEPEPAKSELGRENPTDRLAIAAELDPRHDVYGYRFKGQRFDCGLIWVFLQGRRSPLGWAAQETGAMTARLICKTYAGAKTAAQ